VGQSREATYAVHQSLHGLLGRFKRILKLFKPVNCAPFAPFVARRSNALQLGEELVRVRVHDEGECS
jgi:hypothetical protein